MVSPVATGTLRRIRSVRRVLQVAHRAAAAPAREALAAELLADGLVNLAVEVLWHVAAMQRRHRRLTARQPLGAVHEVIVPLSGLSGGVSPLARCAGVRSFHW